MVPDHLADDALIDQPARGDASRVEQCLTLAINMGAVGTFDYDGESVRWRNAAWRHYGGESGTISLDDFYALIDPEFRSWLGREIALTTERGDDVISAEFELHTSMAGVRRIEAKGRVERDAAGAVTRLAGVVRDSTDHYQREQTLLARTMQLSAILKNLLEPLVVVDSDGVIVRVGQAAERLFADDDAGLIGRSIASLLPAVWPAARDHADDPDPADRLRVVRSLDGVRQTLDVKVNRVSAGPRDLLLLFITDASSQIEEERRRALLIEQLAFEAQSSAVGKFASHVAHEVTQPLAAAANFLGIARYLATSGEHGQAIVEPIDFAANQIDRTGKIVRRLLDLALQRGGEKSVVALRPAVEETVALVLAGYGELGIELELELDPAVPEIFVDRIQIQQVLTNLLRNAVQALAGVPRDPRRIVVRSCKVSATVAAIEVRDNGPGIDKAMLATLFTPFATSRGEGEGLGLGLSISRMIVETHGGTLSGANLPQGACFRFTVPMVAGAGRPVRE